MTRYTRYLVARPDTPGATAVAIAELSPFSSSDQTIAPANLRYSPIFPAYLIPNEPPPKPPHTLGSLSFAFSRSPYRLLGKLRPSLNSTERSSVFFSQGLASVVVANADIARFKLLVREHEGCPIEHWPLQDGRLIHERSEQDFLPDTAAPPLDLSVLQTTDNRVGIYLEQISASLAALWHSHRLYLPKEIRSLQRTLKLTSQLKADYESISLEPPSLTQQKNLNATISGLVEIAAALSYAVTQGTTGASPILSHPSPFPHHSLLGVGTSLRALTVFTRYLESALTSRSASEIIERQFPNRHLELPTRIGRYESGPRYNLTTAGPADDEFDTGGAFPEPEHFPLITQFSLRHGFKESKFAVTAASESLSVETICHWTLITLSHEIMHARVRGIFEALFPPDPDGSIITKSVSSSFQAFATRHRQATLRDNLRNVVLNFCAATERADPVRTRRAASARGLTRSDLEDIYLRQKRKAVELFVHFHDYYFTYARHQKLYAMSIWASWIRVAAPTVRPSEYLVRTLATLACGTGLKPVSAFAHAKSVLLDALDNLEDLGIKSPLFGELRQLLSPGHGDLIQRLFDVSYYLIDQVALCFRSRQVAQLIDRIGEDPFSEGSTDATQYSASAYVFAEDGFVSPIRFVMAGLVRSIRGTESVEDLQWLTAWSSLVISSQEISDEPHA